MHACNLAVAVGRFNPRSERALAAARRASPRPWLARAPEPVSLTGHARRSRSGPGAVVCTLHGRQPREVRWAAPARLSHRVQSALAAADGANYLRLEADRDLALSLSHLRLRRRGGDAGARDAASVSAHARQAVGTQYAIQEGGRA